MHGMIYDFYEVIERRDTNSIKWTRYGKEVLPLWVADMDFRAPPPVIAALSSAVEHGVFGYPAAHGPLAAAVAARMAMLYGWKVDPEWVVPVTGIVSGFYAAARALCPPARPGYVIQPPVYMPFNDLEKHLGLVRQEAPLERGKGVGPLEYVINWDLFDEAFGSRGAETGMFLLCHPHNPIGRSWDETSLRRMATTAVDKGAFIVSDEIHAELLLGGARHRPLATLDPEIEKRSVTLVAPSKTFNIAGLFCGFAIIPDAATRRSYEDTIERLTLHPASLALTAAAAAYSGECDDWLAELLGYLAANRDYVEGFVARELPSLRMTRPEATYLSWIDARGLGLDSPHGFFLEKARVALNDGAAFGTGGAGFLRLNFGCPRATLEEALGRMAEAVSRIDGK
jgi:cystathionine beta-lyase